MSDKTVIEFKGKNLRTYKSSDGHTRLTQEEAEDEILLDAQVFKLADVVASALGYGSLLELPEERLKSLIDAVRNQLKLHQ